MRRRTLAATVTVAVLLLTSGCLGAVAANDGGSNAAPTNRSIDVSATGQVSAQANQAVVQVAVVAHGEDAETARQRLAENVSNLRAGLSAAGVASDQITTSGYDIREDYREPREGERPDRRYVARQSFEITLSDTDRTGAVIDAAVQNGASRVDGVRFTLSTERRDELKRQALQDAMDRARSKAETLAAASNMTVVQATRVQSAEFDHGPVYAEATAVADSGGGTTIDSGPVTVTATVHVTYEAE